MIRIPQATQDTLYLIAVYPLIDPTEASSKFQFLISYSTIQSITTITNGLPYSDAIEHGESKFFKFEVIKGDRGISLSKTVYYSNIQIYVSLN